MKETFWMAAAAVWAIGDAASAGDGSPTPRPAPIHRPEVKKALDDLKYIKPRISPLPLTDEDRQRGMGGNDRYRGYLPKELQATRSFTRDPDPNMTLSYAFKTELFWIVSRVNNCHY